MAKKKKDPIIVPPVDLSFEETMKRLLSIKKPTTDNTPGQTMSHSKPAFGKTWSIWLSGAKEGEAGLSVAHVESDGVEHSATGADPRIALQNLSEEVRRKGYAQTDVDKVLDWFYPSIDEQSVDTTNMVEWFRTRGRVEGREWELPLEHRGKQYEVSAKDMEGKYLRVTAIVCKAGSPDEGDQYVMTSTNKFAALDMADVEVSARERIDLWLQTRG
jgi:hypothetical protein